MLSNSLLLLQHCSLHSYAVEILDEEGASTNDVDTAISEVPQLYVQCVSVLLI